MSAVSFERVTRRFQDVTAVDQVSFDIQAGEFFTLLGPSGSGKTTCLRMIAGFEFANEGTIRIYGDNVVNKPPFDRNVNTVFQDYALFPHMTIRDNIAYGLMVGGVGKRTRHAKAEDMLELVQLPGVGDRKPAQLSGGQRQRIAIARALINQPKILLLDEPLGALDLKLREQMQIELKNLQRQIGITFVFVTHDQQEALSMSDRVCIFNQGKIEQMGSPDEIYEHPASEFVARFVGHVNLFEGEQAYELMHQRQTGMLRPERIHLEAGHHQQARIHGQILTREYHGAFIRYAVRCESQIDLIVHQPNHGDDHATYPHFTVGDNVSLHWSEHAVHPIQVTEHTRRRGE